MKTTLKDELTEKEEKLLAFYVAIENQRPPSLSQCTDHMKVQSKATILKALNQLKKKGYI